jgi:hypothetical protein
MKNKFLFNSIKNKKSKINVNINSVKTKTNFLVNNFEYFKLYIYNLKYSKLLTKKLVLTKKNIEIITILLKLFFFNKNLNLSFLLKFIKYKSLNVLPLKLYNFKGKTFNDLYFINFNKNDKFKFLLKKNNYLDYLQLKRFAFFYCKKAKIKTLTNKKKMLKKKKKNKRKFKLKLKIHNKKISVLKSYNKKLKKKYFKIYKYIKLKLPIKKYKNLYDKKGLINFELLYKILIGDIFNNKNFKLFYKKFIKIKNYIINIINYFKQTPITSLNQYKIKNNNNFLWKQFFKKAQRLFINQYISRVLKKRTNKFFIRRNKALFFKNNLNLKLKSWKDAIYIYKRQRKCFKNLFEK